MKRFAFAYYTNISVPNVGNTVIHLDQALARMKEYERMKTEAENNSNMRCTCRVTEDEDGAVATTVNNLEGVFFRFI
jgi:pericentriolar material 1 protein